jgi:hypothetical protein
MTVALERGLPGLMHEAGVATVVVYAFWIPGILAMRQGYSIFALRVLLPIYQGPIGMNVFNSSSYVAGAFAGQAAAAQQRSPMRCCCSSCAAAWRRPSCPSSGCCKATR